MRSEPTPIRENANILELGCGNGELARTLARRDLGVRYTGVDFNARLLEIARQSLPAERQASFYQANLASSEWARGLPNCPYDVVLAFAVLHHLPGAELRRRVLEKVRELITPDGIFIHSEWQFLNSSRLRDRIQTWEQAGLSAEDVDPGDYLLDWREGGYGLRYAHHFSEAELEALAGDTGFQVVETFYSDGEGGNLGLYQLWKPRE
jgi:tRNA (uracil-5-)-methyltransferase TRM9